MRQEYDVTRSLVRYVSLILPEFEIREAAEQGAIQRPGAVVELATPETRVDAGTSVTVLELAATYNIFVYPEMGDSPLESRAIASRLGARIGGAFDSGFDAGRQGLVPLYDYDGIPVDGTSTARRPQDFARVLDLSLTPKQSPDDERRFSLPIEVRLGWKRDRMLPSSKRTTDHLRIGFQN